MAKGMTRNDVDIAREPEPEYGPAMRALPSPKWRRAVEFVFLTNGDMTKAIELAGYRGKRESLRVMACRIFADNRMRAAIKEECNKRIDITEPELLLTAMEVFRNPGEKAADRLRAVAMVWDRANPVMTKHKIEVEHHLSSDERDIQHYRAMKKIGAASEAFLARFGPNGLARVEAMIALEDSKLREIEGQTIEADYVEIAPEETVAPEAAPEQKPEQIFDEDMDS
jgi:hypothetical protein